MDKNTTVVMTADETNVDNKKKKKGFIEDFDIDSFQKYILGYKKDGVPRAIYDVFKDYQKLKKKKKKRKSDDDYVMYFPSLTKSKKKKKKKHR